MHFGTEKEVEQGTATDDIAAGDPPSDLTSSVPAFILHTPDGPDPPSDLASSIPALSLPTPDGPALSDPIPDCSPPSPDDHFLPPPGWLESPDHSLQIVAASASPMSVLAASESSSDVVVPATLQSPPDPVFSARLSSPARLQQIFYLNFYAVLVTHNGFSFDLPVLLAEVE